MRIIVALGGTALARRGEALEAEVQRSPRSVDAWRLLGTVHAENDDDVQACPHFETNNDVLDQDR